MCVGGSVGWSSRRESVRRERRVWLRSATAATTAAKCYKVADSRSYRNNRSGTCVDGSLGWITRRMSWSVDLRRVRASFASPFRIMTATTVPLAAAIAVEVTVATVVMNKSNRDNISRGAAAVLDSSSMIGANDKRHRNR